MKLVLFSVKNQYPVTDRLGAVAGNIIIDLAASYRAYLIQQKKCEVEAAWRLASALLPGDTVQYLEGGALSREAAEQAIAFAQNREPVLGIEKLAYDAEEVQLYAPIKRPRSLRDFLSFEEHLKNCRKDRSVPPEWYEIPVYYKGSTATIVGPEAQIEWPSYSQVMDYELELAVVIGKSGKDIPVQEAGEYIAGYMIMNDFSARDIQLKEMNVGLGPAKGKDFATAFGPWLVTPDEIPDPYNLKMVARVNGELWSEGNTKTMYRTFAEIIAYASKAEKLVAGDVIGSGTVGTGCGLELGKFLKSGDVVELEIEHLGILRNYIAK